MCSQEFQAPKRPFRRMNYTDAIEWLKENNVTKDDGTLYEFGDVSSSFFSSDFVCLFVCLTCMETGKLM